MINNNIFIKIIKQKYLEKLIKKNPNITAGRKNYKYQQERVYKNIYLSNEFKKQGIKKFLDVNLRFIFK